MVLKKLQELTFGELKGFLLSKGQSTEGTKADCYIRVEELFRMEGKNPSEVQINVTEKVRSRVTSGDSDTHDSDRRDINSTLMEVMLRMENSLRSLSISFEKLANVKPTQVVEQPPAEAVQCRNGKDLLEVRNQTADALTEEPVELPVSPKATALSASTLFEMELPTFSGEDWEDPLIYLDTLQSVLQHYSIPLRTWTPVGIRQLRGKATQWWNTQMMHQPGQWHEFRHLLSNRFSNQTVMAKLRAEYYATGQKKKEDVVTFLNRKYALFRRLFRDQPPAQFMEHVVELIEPRIRSCLRGFRHNIIEDFIEMAGRIEKDSIPREYHPEHGRNQGRPNQTEKGQNHAMETEDPEESPAVNVEIGNLSLLAKVDTQASKSFLRTQLAKKLGLRILPTTTLEVQLGTKPNKVKTDGEVEVVIKIQGIYQKVRAILLKELSYKMILGNDWLTREQVILDYGEKSLTMGNHPRKTITWGIGRQPEDPPRLELRAEQFGNSLTDQERKDVQSTLQTHATVFFGLGRTRSVQHQIVLTDKKVVKLPCYRYNEIKKNMIINQIRDMEATGIIRPSTSAYASPIVMVPKPNNEWRFCVNYQEINKITRSDAYPMPSVQEQLRGFSGSTYFSTIDLKSGYWQVELDEESRQYTAFASPIGLFEFNVMPFGLKNSPMTFQRLMEEVVRGYVGEFVEVYLDDIIIHSPDFPSHLIHIRKVLERLKQHGLTCHPEKCRFALREIKFLGHIIDGEGITPNPQKIQEALEYGPPTNRRQMQQFLGLCQWFATFIPDLGELAAPLYQLTGKKGKWHWGTEQETSFQALKDRLSKTQKLAHLNPDLPLFLQTDASEIGLGAILFQTEKDSPPRIIAFGSRQLKDAERRYSAVEREALAIVWGIQKFRDYLEGRKFTLVTDSEGLTWMKQMKDRNGKIYRWFMLVMGYDFQTLHCKGRDNQAADSLSRNPGEDSWELQEDPLWPPSLSWPKSRENSPILANLKKLWEEIRTSQDKDPKLSEIKKIVEQPGDRTKWRQYTILDGILYLRPRSGQPKIMIPTEQTNKVLKMFHDDEGHPGVLTTLQRVQSKVSWRGVTKDVKQYVKGCKTCQAVKPNNRPFVDIQVARDLRTPFQQVAVDIMGPYPRSSNGKTHLLVVTDIFSRWVEAFPMGQPTATKILQTIEKEVFHRFGYPEKLLSDNGSQFISREWLHHMEEWGVEAETTPVYHPRANPAERRNQEIKKLMRTTLINRPHKEWDRHMSESLFFLRNRVNSNTGYSPASLIFSHEPKKQGEWQTMINPPNISLSYLDWQREKTQRIQEQMEKIKKEGEGRKGRKKTKQKGVRPQPSEGDQVWIKTRTLSKAGEKICAALNPKWEGPYIIIKQVSQCIYLVQNKEVTKKIHSKDMKPYYDDPKH